MTTDRQMAGAVLSQAMVVAALEQVGQTEVAARLRRCADARSGRRSNDGWPWTCRSAGCLWCRRPLIRRWWAGIQAWCPPDGRTLVIIPVRYGPGGLRFAVQRLRRGLRDLRDRRAQRSHAWRQVCFAGLLTGGGMAMVLVDRGRRVDRAELSAAIRRRWPDATVTDLMNEVPSMAVTLADAVELASLRRGAEPLRIVVMPQRS
jgi:hypothetical protein